MASPPRRLHLLQAVRTTPVREHPAAPRTHAPGNTMTRRHLRIAIDANRVTCGRCVFRGSYRREYACNASSVCSLYGEYLPGYKRADNYNGLFPRCAPCLKAERLAAEKGEA